MEKKESAVIPSESCGFVEGGSNIEYLHRIKLYYDSLSKSQKKIADYFCEHQGNLLDYSINQLAAKIGTNAPAITRFAQSLGFKGFSELKFFVSKDLLSPFEESGGYEVKDPVSLLKQKIIVQNERIINDTIMLLDDVSVCRAAQTLMKANSISFFAEGGSAAPLMSAYHMFLQLNLPCRMYTDAFVGVSAASQLKVGDVAFSSSFSGSNINSINFLKEAKSKKAATIAITAYPNSGICEHADFVFLASSKITNDLCDMHSARVSELCIVGLLQVYIYLQRREKMEDNLKNLMDAVKITRQKSCQNVRF